MSTNTYAFGSDAAGQVQHNYRQYAIKRAIELNGKAAVLKQQGLQGAALRKALRHGTNITLSTVSSPYGNTSGFLDPCGDNDYISLSMAGRSPLMDWMGVEGSDKSLLRFGYLLSVADVKSYAAAGTADGSIAVADLCAPGATADFREAKQEVNGFALFRSTTEGVNPYEDGLKNCETDPLFRLDGSVITNNSEWMAVLASEILMQQAERFLFAGALSTSGATIPGIDAIVNTGQTDYTSTALPQMNSVVVDMNNGAMVTGATPTWSDYRTNVALPVGISIMEVFKHLKRYFDARKSIVKTIANVPKAYGDTVIVGSSEMIDNLMDIQACYHTCEQNTNLTLAQVVELMANRETMAMRESLSQGGMFGYGDLLIEGERYPLLKRDFGNDPNTLYMLTRGIGPVDFLKLQHQDFNATNSMREATIDITDGGKIHNWKRLDGICEEYNHDMALRLKYRAPFMQARITNITAPNFSPMAGVSFDPDDAAFFAGLG